MQIATILVWMFLAKWVDNYKKAKPALCFARIAKAILGGTTLHNSNFLLNKKAKPVLCDDVTLHNSNFLLTKKHPRRTSNTTVPRIKQFIPLSRCDPAPDKISGLFSLYCS